VTGPAVSNAQIAAASALVLLAMAVSLWRRAGLEAGLAEAAVRSLVQLSLVGLVIGAVLDSGEVALTVALLGVMVVIAALTARGRARRVPGAFGPLLGALAAATAVVLGLLVALDVFPATPRYLLPVGGMVIGNAMTAAAVALNRLADEVATRSGEIEAVLALGAPSGLAVRPHARTSLRSGMIPLIDSTKTTGLVAFPGVLVGSLLAGADAGQAVRLQLVILWVLLGGVAVAALAAVALGARRLFTSAHQLVELPEVPAGTPTGRPWWRPRG
jgi:putative ABC transport system permease protein